MTNAFETNNLTKIYGKKTVLNKININVEEKSIHGLIGLNGAGKSTLLKILSGMTDPTSGSFKILEVDMPLLFPTIKVRIGYLPENPVLYRSLRVKELLSFVGTLNGLARDLIDERVGKYSRLFDFEALLQTFVGDLSKGENQKVALCAVLVKEPQIYLLDDPFTSLDPISQITLRNVLSERVKEGSTILFSTHNMQFIKNLCESVTMLHKGNVIFTGKLEDFMIHQDGSLSLEDSFVERLRGT